MVDLPVPVPELYLGRQSRASVVRFRLCGGSLLACLDSISMRTGPILCLPEILIAGA